MIKFEFSEHAYDMLKERNIKKEWIRLAMEEPDKKEEKNDGTVHYIRAIKEYKGRYLRVVVNPAFKPPRVITVFFDHRIGRRS